MFENLEIFRMAKALAIHSSARQVEIAANVANADTPGYRARDITPFSEVFDRRHTDGSLRTTRAGHLSDGLPDGGKAFLLDLPGTSDPNGNTVSLETEMIKAIETKQAHETALSIYETTRNILRTSLGRGR